MQSRFVLVGVLVLSSSMTRVAADVLVVGPGQAYTQIQAAVNAASSGDTILVRPGNYSPVVVDGKALSITGDGATLPVVQSGHLEIRNVPAGANVLVARMRTTIGCTGNAGEVRFASCELTGWVQDNSGGMGFTACQFQGHDVTGISFDGPYGGVAGLIVRGTRVSMHDCVLRGGRGGDDITYAGAGGPGLMTFSSFDPAFTTFAHLSNCTLTGGRGGDTWENLFDFIARVGDGGDGLSCGAGTSVWLLDTQCVGGPRGTWHTCLPQYYGVDGLPIDGPGDVTTFQVEALAMSGPVLVRDDQPTITLSVSGRPGDEVWLAIGGTPGFLAAPSWRGVLLLRPRRPQYDLVHPWVVLDGTGQGTITLSVPDVAYGTSGMRMTLQAWRQHPNGTLTMGSSIPVTVIDAGY